MEPEEAVMFGALGYVILTIVYFLTMAFTIFWFDDRSIRLMVLGLVTGIAAVGYETVSSWADLAEVRGSQAMIQLPTSEIVAATSHLSASDVMGRLGVLLVAAGVARYILGEPATVAQPAPTDEAV